MPLLVFLGLLAYGIYNLFGFFAAIIPILVGLATLPLALLADYKEKLVREQEADEFNTRRERVLNEYYDIKYNGDDR